MQYDNQDQIHTSSSAPQIASAPSKVVNPAGDPTQQPTWTQALGDKPPAGLQAKLTVSQPGDAYEQEADQVVEQVMRMPTSSTTTPSTIPEQDKSLMRKERKASGSGQAIEGAPPIVNQALSSGGQPLHASTQSTMESRFGHDFSDVRVHTDEQAAESAQAVNARAYTVGKDVVFGAGQYEPGTSEGQRLLAHELVHVVQQSNRSASQLLRQTQRDIARDEHLRSLAARPGLALVEWKRLTEGDRTVVVTYMTMKYSSEFARYFLATTSRHSRPETVINITNSSDMTPEQLTKQGYRLAGSISMTQIWVRPDGQEVWLLPQTGASGQQDPASSPQTQSPPDNPPHIDLPANPVSVYGAVTASRDNAQVIVMGVTGRVVRYADGTVEVYPVGSTDRYTFRPQPGGVNAYDFYDENGNKTTLIATDFDEVFNAGSGQTP